MDIQTHSILDVAIHYSQKQEAPRDITATTTQYNTDVSSSELRDYLLTCLSTATHPRAFFDVLDAVEALETYYPTIHQLQTVRAGPKEYHREGTTYEHTMRVLEEVNKLQPNNETLLLSALSHDFGKIQTPEEKLPHHPEHTKTGLSVVEQFAERLQLSSQHIESMKTAVQVHMKLYNVSQFNDSTLVQFAQEIVSSNQSLTELIDLTIADGRGKEPEQQRNVKEIRKTLEPAIETVNSISKSDVIEKYNLDKTNNSKIRDLLIQERTEHYRS